MRKILVTAALLATSLFAGPVFAERASGTEKPSMQNIRASRADLATRTMERIRMSSERPSMQRPSARPDRVQINRPRGDMSEPRVNRGGVDRAGAAVAGKQGSMPGAVQNRVRPRGEVIGGTNKTKGPGSTAGVRTSTGARAFTIANDRRNRADGNGPRTIADIMKRKVAMQWLGAAGVKLNCQTVGTCAMDPL